MFLCLSLMIRYIYIIVKNKKKKVFKQQESQFLALLYQGSGSRVRSRSIPRTNVSGAGWAKNIWLRQIRIQIQSTNKFSVVLFGFQILILFIFYRFIFLLQDLPDDQERSSSSDEDLPEDSDHGANEGVDEDKEEDDRLVTSSWTASASRRGNSLTDTITGI